MRLSLPMIRALRQIRDSPGQSWTDYERVSPRTVQALERRGLIIVVADEKLRPTFAGRHEHLHQFQLTMHLDGCHWYRTAARCECGAVYSCYGERDPQGDPYSGIWMEPNGDDERCSRCEELMAGARPRYFEGIGEPKGTAA